MAELTELAQRHGRQRRRRGVDAEMAARFGPDRGICGIQPLRPCVAAKGRLGLAIRGSMKNTRYVLALLSLVCSACGEEDTHDHEAGDFASLAECEAHYEDEGHTASQA